MEPLVGKENVHFISLLLVSPVRKFSGIYAAVFKKNQLKEENIALFFSVLGIRN
jgi:hypothetical protein